MWTIRSVPGSAGPPSNYRGSARCSSTWKTWPPSGFHNHPPTENVTQRLIVVIRFDGHQPHRPAEAHCEDRMSGFVVSGLFQPGVTPAGYEAAPAGDRQRQAESGGRWN